jgi:two-component system chemotaxis sensor kinase CheA
MSDPSSELLRVFRDELSESVDKLALHIEAAATDPEGSAANREAAMHVAHNIKGAARIVGFEAVVTVAHALEDVLGELPEHPPQALTKELLAGVTLLELLASARADAAEANAFAVNLRGWLDPGAKAGARKPRRRKNGRPAPSPPPVALEAAAAPGDPSPPPALAAPGGESSVRIAVDRLDRLMTATGELLTVRARQEARNLQLAALTEELARLRRRLSGEAAEGCAALERRLGDLQKADRRETRQFHTLADEIRDALRRVRMMPLAGMVGQWRRILRESARSSGKDAQLVALVGDVELDRRVLEEISDPIMHLLRNAVGHGIESEEERRAAGKPVRGTVEIQASLCGSMVRLEIRDDGRGIQRQAVLRRALERGLLSETDAAGLSNHDLCQLLFAAGFSTAVEVSELSGRGVGLDIVRQRVKSVGGSVVIVEQSQLGGAAFVMDLPVSLVSTRGLLVQAADLVCAIPVDSVSRTLRVATAQLRPLDGGLAFPMEGGDPLRVRWLRSLIGQEREPDPDRITVVVLERAGQRLGLAVDRLLGEDDFVAKRLPWNLEGIAGISGAFLMGDGKIALVLDVAQLALIADGTPETMPAARASERRRIMVVDDSLTARTLERNLLQSAGYEVLACVDGEEAWRRLHETPVDVLVTDVQMPKIDGFELTRKVRGDARLKSLPVVLVTGLGKEADLAEGARSGADEYIVKGQFDQRQLLAAVARLA